MKNLNCLGHLWVTLCASSVLPASLWYSDPLFPHLGRGMLGFWGGPFGWGNVRVLRVLSDSTIAPPPKPQHLPPCACASISPPGLPGVPSKPTVGQGVSPQASSPRCSPRDSTDSRCRGDFPLLMLKRKFHFPVSDEHFPFGLEKPLPPQHAVEGCKHALKQQIPLPASAFLFPPKTQHPPSWHHCGIAHTSSWETPLLTRVVYIGAACFFLNFLGVNS